LAVTLAELRQRVQSRLAEPIAAGNWFTPDTVNYYINDAIRQTFLKIVEANPDWFGLRKYSFTTTDGQGEYSIPIDAFEIRYVAHDDGFNLDVPRKLDDWQQQYRFMIRSRGKPIAFYWTTDYSAADPATLIGFIPIPDSQYQMHVWYVPRPRRLVNDSDTLDLPDEVADIIVPLATALALKSDKQLAQQEEAEYQARLVQYLSFVTRGKSGGPVYVNYTYPLW